MTDLAFPFKVEETRTFVSGGQGILKNRDEWENEGWKIARRVQRALIDGAVMLFVYVP